MRPGDEIARRRTFAIISHPDAGKTTLTEKMLLYSGAVQLAGSVTARKQQRSTSSDWMELEQKRGISISSTVLQFEYLDHRINLLDTPGHKDFSEDTYRVLTAVDAAVMVIDAAKGIEPETRKLFEVCRARGVPIFTFINKLDRPTMPLLGLLDELESVLGIQAYAANWPLGTGTEFKGVFDRQDQRVHLFERAPHGSYRAPVDVLSVDDPVVAERLNPEVLATVREEVEIIEGAGSPFDLQAVHAGELTPVFFGSAMNNFGVQLLLDAFIQNAPPPGPRASTAGIVKPDAADFSGFIFKIQANTDPRHRDRIAYIRIVSGQFNRDTTVTHAQSGRKVRLGTAHALFGRDRETVDVAYPGDVIGVACPREFRIGDTLTESPAIRYEEIPRFAPECFAYLHNPTPGKYKRFDQGVEQLLEEGVVQRFTMPQRQQKVTLLAAVGPLQFEIVQHRLENEYGAESRLESTPWNTARWLADPSKVDHQELSLPSGVEKAMDPNGEPVLLFSDDWQLRFFADRNADVELLRQPAANQPDPTAG